MSKIISNERLCFDFYLMRAECANEARMGQFYMLRAWDRYPVLSRPVSVFDTDGETVSFLYKVVGKGTEIFSGLKAEGDITIQGPLGNSFPEVSGNIALVGGGVGIAPLYLAAKQLKVACSGCQIDIYLGFSKQEFLTDEYRQVADSVIVDVGGFITDTVEPSRYDHLLTCGPEAMMRTLYEKCKKDDTAEKLYVSLESRMACGVGACFGCSRKTADGNKKICKDGPVFKAKAVFEI